ncbi:MAG: TonB family protein, partial [Polyangiaceae bacterium]
MRIGQSSLSAFALVLLTSTQAFAQDPQPAAPARAIPPKEISHVDAVYPAGLVASGVHADVVLVVTVDTEGHVSDIEVRQSGGADLDAAASDAMRKWLFSPALRDGKPVSSRIRVPFHFAPPGPPAPPENANTPLVEGHTTSQTGSGPASVSPAQSAVQQIAPKPTPPSRKPAPITPEEDVDSVSVTGQATTPEHSASDVNFKFGALSVVPKKNA